MEKIILILLLIRSSQILNQTYKQIIIKTESKVIQITEKAIKIYKILFMRYKSDLILIGNAFLLNDKDIYDSKKIINNESNLFNLNNKIKYNSRKI